MGRKGGKYKKKDSDSPITNSKRHDASEDDPMNDEIDAFHNQRDLVPLDVNEDGAESDEDIDQPVFDIEDDDDDDEDDSDDDGTQLTGLAAKIARQQKYLRAQVGGVEEENDEDADADEKDGGWGRSKNTYYNADDSDSEDEEITAAEEAEALRMVKEKAKSLTAEDFGLEDSESESDKEHTYEEILVQGKPLGKANLGKKTEDDSTTAYEEVMKDLNEMTREEQMDVVLSSAPELVGLLSEFGDTLEHLENKVNPLLNKIRDADKATPGGIEYVQMKQQLLLSYCQAITFYLLLKSEGQPVRDHPVISRLVEIKSLLDKMGELDKNLPAELEDILVRDQSSETVEKEAPVMKSCPATGVNKSSAVPAHIPDNSEAPEGSSRVVNEIPIKEQKLKKSHTKQQDNEVGMQSLQMLKVRADLEQKLREKGILRSIANNDEVTRKRARPVNGQLETLDDFDDDAMDLDKVNNQSMMRNGSPVHARKLSKLVARQGNKPKVISGDDDLPKRDDIGERRRKHELRVLAGAGIKSVDDVDDMPGSPLSDGSDGSDGDSDIKSGLDFYNQVKQKHSAKLAAKSQKYSRSVNAEPLSEPLVDGKRQISYQMEKNRGLTPSRKKLIKNPRKKYKLKHKKTVTNRSGQVREIRKQTGQYGGETTGINHLVTRSIRFKN